LKIVSSKENRSVWWVVAVGLNDEKPVLTSHFFTISSGSKCLSSNLRDLWEIVFYTQKVNLGGLLLLEERININSDTITNLIRIFQCKESSNFEYSINDYINEPMSVINKRTATENPTKLRLKMVHFHSRRFLIIHLIGLINGHLSSKVAYYPVISLMFM
jgi:hypothetical protein